MFKMLLLSLFALTGLVSANETAQKLKKELKQTPQVKQEVKKDQKIYTNADLRKMFTEGMAELRKQYKDSLTISKVDAKKMFEENNKQFFQDLRQFGNKK